MRHEKRPHEENRKIIISQATYMVDKLTCSMADIPKLSEQVELDIEVKVQAEDNKLMGPEEDQKVP